MYFIDMPQHRCDIIRAKVLGGCSVVNGMMYIRGIPQDFQRWVEAGNTHWGYDQVLPYFQNIEDNRELGTVADFGYHGVEGPLTISRFPDYPAFADDFLAAAEELGFGYSQDLNGENISGFAIAQTTNR